MLFPVQNVPLIVQFITAADKLIVPFTSESARDTMPFCAHMLGVWHQRSGLRASYTLDFDFLK